MAAPAPYIVLDPLDNVATLIQALPAGTEIATAAGPLTLVQDIPYGHKVALADIAAGGEIIKYGALIGRASAPIRRGEHVHVHNVKDITAEVRTL